MIDNNIAIVVDDEYYRVEIHESTSMMYVLWKCHVEGDLLKEKFKALVEVITNYRPERWLGNAKATYYTTVQDARWIFHTFIPTLIQSSVFRYARVETKNSLMALDSMSLHDKLNTMNEEERGVLEFQFFTEEEPAKRWLFNQIL